MRLSSERWKAVNEARRKLGNAAESENISRVERTILTHILYNSECNIMLVEIGMYNIHGVPEKIDNTLGMTISK